MSMGQKSTGFLRRLKRMMKDDAGNIAIMFGLSALPLFISLGVAVDTIRAAREQTAFQSAVDSAAVALAADPKSDVSALVVGSSPYIARMAQLKALALNYINANFQSSTGPATDITVDDPAIVKTTITLTAHHTFPTAIMGLFGTPSLTLNTSSQTERGGSGGIELVLVMDTTGSMGAIDPKTGIDYETEAMTAAHKLLEALYGGSPTAKTTSAKIRVSLVPFNTGVQLDTSAYDFNLGWIDTTRANPLSTMNYTITKKGKTTITGDNYAAWDGSWNGCVEARSIGNISTDTAPVGGSTLFPAMFIDGVDNCAVSKMVPMTYDRANVETGIDNMVASGYTNIAEGMAWGMRAISPTEPFTKVEASGSNAATNIALYEKDQPKNTGAIIWHKVVVMMTDGENNIPSSYTSYGYGGVSNLNRFGTTSGTSAWQAVADQNLADVCSNLKANGVEIYTTGFHMDNSSSSLAAKAKIKACATDAAHFTDSTDGPALQQYFASVGQTLNNSLLYVSK